MRKLLTVFVLFLILPMLFVSLVVADETRDIYEAAKLANNKIAENALELYLVGNLPEASQAFKRMLEIDCGDVLARVYLQKIADQGAEYQYAEDYMQQLSCPGSGLPSNNVAASVKPQQPVIVKSEILKTSVVDISNVSRDDSSMYFPTGRRDSSVIYVRKDVPAVVRIGEVFAYTIAVQNISDMVLENVNISEVIPSGFVVDSLVPNSVVQEGNKARWVMSKLSPNEVQTIKIVGRTDDKQDLPCCTKVDYELPALCVQPLVIKPELAIEFTAPVKNMICDSIPLLFKVSNKGDGTISGVKIVSDLPVGVESPEGTQSLRIDVGDLAEGQSKEVAVYVKAQKTGSKAFMAKADSTDGLSVSTDSVVTEVSQPRLVVSASSARPAQYIGRDINYTFTVKNTGDAEAQNAVLQATVPGNTRYASASNGGRLGDKKVQWEMGALPAGQSQEVTMKLVALEAGQAISEVITSAVCCSKSEVVVSSAIEGIPALLLEVVDVEDPIEVGGAETYVITVTNQGSADATNIQITAVLENMVYASSSGATSGSASGERVAFAPLARLGAKNKAEWRVEVKAEKAGDTRFKATMNSDQLGRVVEETESTFIY